MKVIYVTLETTRREEARHERDQRIDREGQKSYPTFIAFIGESLRSMEKPHLSAIRTKQREKRSCYGFVN